MQVNLLFGLDCTAESMQALKEKGRGRSPQSKHDESFQFHCNGGSRAQVQPAMSILSSPLNSLIWNFKNKAHGPRLAGLLEPHNVIMNL